MNFKHFQFLQSIVSLNQYHIHENLMQKYARVRVYYMCCTTSSFHVHLYIFFSLSHHSAQNHCSPLITEEKPFVNEFTQMCSFNVYRTNRDSCKMICVCMKREENWMENENDDEKAGGKCEIYIVYIEKKSMKEF